MSNFAQLTRSNLITLFNADSQHALAQNLPAEPVGTQFQFRAFGDVCLLGKAGIFLRRPSSTGVMELLISIYALNSRPDPVRLTPYKAFRELPNSMPYIGAFATHTEAILMPHVGKIDKQSSDLASRLDGRVESGPECGDFSLILRPLPKIVLKYIFYRADHEFPASVSCLFSYNAGDFLPTDALADTGEMTSRKLLDYLR